MCLSVHIIKLVHLFGMEYTLTSMVLLPENRQKLTLCVLHNMSVKYWMIAGKWTLFTLTKAKALDRLDHTMLLNKLSEFSLGDQFIERSYLDNRLLLLLIMVSTRRVALPGVPQGSNLGPAVFNACILMSQSVYKIVNLSFH